MVCSPSFQEGPHSALNEDEFFDALEMAYQIGESEHVSSVKAFGGGGGGGLTYWLCVSGC